MRQLAIFRLLKPWTIEAGTFGAYVLYSRTVLPVFLPTTSLLSTSKADDEPFFIHSLYRLIFWSTRVLFLIWWTDNQAKRAIYSKWVKIRTKRSCLLLNKKRSIKDSVKIGGKGNKLTYCWAVPCTVSLLSSLSLSNLYWINPLRKKSGSHWHWPIKLPRILVV